LSWHFDTLFRLRRLIGDSHLRPPRSGAKRCPRPPAPDPRRASFAASAIAQFGNIGTFSGPPLFAAGVATMGWSGGAVFVAATCAIGIFLSYMLHLAARNRI
jgi:hypothetical protein